jgi:hypothetical protein
MEYSDRIIMEALRTSETSVYSYQTTGHYIPESGAGLAQAV